jgi:hypothetical protein
VKEPKTAPESKTLLPPQIRLPGSAWPQNGGACKCLVVEFLNSVPCPVQRSRFKREPVNPLA